MCGLPLMSPIADYDAASVCFYSSEDDQLIGCVDNVSSGTSASVAWTGLSDDDTYGWYAVVDDGTESRTSETWSFSTSSPLPSVGGSSYPGTTDAALTVTIGDHDGDDTFEVSFYDGSGTLIATETGVEAGDEVSVVWENLTAGTQYSWYVRISDGTYTQTSETWTFTTESTGSAVPVPALGLMGIIAAALMLIGAGMIAVRRKTA